MPYTMFVQRFQPQGRRFTNFIIIKINPFSYVNIDNRPFPATALDKKKKKKSCARATHTHTRNTCQASYLEIRRISCIRHYLAHDALKTVICARTDYSNSLLAGCPNSFFICKLQKVQNNAARLISRSARSDHISPILRVLHWLPVKSRKSSESPFLSL